MSRSATNGRAPISRFSNVASEVQNLAVIGERHSACSVRTPSRDLKALEKHRCAVHVGQRKRVVNEGRRLFMGPVH